MFLQSWNNESNRLIFYLIKLLRYVIAQVTVAIIAGHFDWCDCNWSHQRQLIATGLRAALSDYWAACTCRSWIDFICPIYLSKAIRVYIGIHKTSAVNSFYHSIVNSLNMYFTQLPDEIKREQNNNKFECSLKRCTY